MDKDEVCCEECGQPTSLEELFSYHGQILCEDCYDDHFPACVFCGDNYDRDYDERHNGAWGNMCVCCSHNHFVCDSCGETYLNDDYGEDGLCVDCCHLNKAHIHDYHDSGVSTNFLPESGNNLYFGVELETENYHDLDTTTKELYNLSRGETLFHLEEDCSLRDGVEIISQPCTLDYHRTQFPWTQVCDTAKKGEAEAQSSEAAALHIHFSARFFRGKHNELYQLRLIYLFEKFWGQLVILARTNNYLLNRSCLKYSQEVPKERNLFDCSAYSKIRRLKDRTYRYMAVNLHSSQDTIEIRIFKSTLKPNVIIASIELVDFLVHLAKNKSTKKLQLMTWADLLKKIRGQDYPALIAYIKEKDADNL